MAERNRLLNEYFPYRSAIVLADIQRIAPSGIYPVNSPDSSLPPPDSKLYNLQGQEVQHPSPGIYIRNGKKVIIKE